MRKPSRLFALGIASYLVVVVAALETPRSCFTPGWFNVVWWIFFPLALLSIFAAVFLYGRKEGWPVLGAVIGSLLSTVLLGGIAIYVTLVITLEPGCFS